MKRHSKVSVEAIKPRFQASLRSDGVLEMQIYGDIVNQDYITMMEWYGIPTDGMVSSIGVKKQIDQAAGSFSKIVLRINSPGGSAFEGIAIGNIIKSSGKPIEVHIDAIAASAASVVAMCGNTITMANNAMMMVHNAWTDCEGYAADMRKMADTLDTISASIAQTYADKSGKSLEDVIALMDAETWMGATECLEMGFCTAIAKEQAEPAAMAMAKGFQVLNQMKHVPEALKAAAAAPQAEPPRAEVNNEQQQTEVCECPCQSCADGNCSDCTNSSCNDENCENCPMQGGGTGNSSNLSLFQCRQWEIERGIRAA